MNSARTPAIWLLLCTVVFTMRMADVHVHHCLDGRELSQSLHWADAGVHADDVHLDGSHADVERGLANDALVKTAPPGFDLPAVIFAALLLLSLIISRTPIITPEHDARQRRSPRFLRPLLRGPPA